MDSSDVKVHFNTSFFKQFFINKK